MQEHTHIPPPSTKHTLFAHNTHRTYMLYIYVGIQYTLVESNTFTHTMYKHTLPMRAQSSGYVIYVTYKKHFICTYSVLFGPGYSTNVLHIQNAINSVVFC